MEPVVALIAVGCCALAPIGIGIAWLLGTNKRDKSVPGPEEMVTPRETARRGK